MYLSIGPTTLYPSGIASSGLTGAYQLVTTALGAPGVGGNVPNASPWEFAAPTAVADTASAPSSVRKA